MEEKDQDLIQERADLLLIIDKINKYIFDLAKLKMKVRSLINNIGC